MKPKSKKGAKTRAAKAPARDRGAVEIARASEAALALGRVRRDLAATYRRYADLIEKKAEHVERRAGQPKPWWISASHEVTCDLLNTAMGRVASRIQDLQEQEERGLDDYSDWTVAAARKAGDIDETLLPKEVL